MIVHELAMESGVSTHAVRYYAKIGLLTPTRDPNNGYQHFTRADSERMRFVRRAQRLGLTLAEIKHLLSRSQRGTGECCGSVAHKLHVRIKDVRKQIARLQAMEQSIVGALSIWESRPGCGAQAQTRLCPFIETMDLVGGGHGERLGPVLEGSARPSDISALDLGPPHRF
ncbi:MAG: MerR family transcriptional regulator [Gammaproteobacteria bacterium]|nr:MerR family transcriptional regulator [Gammaproteobacteria bacterium]